MAIKRDSLRAQRDFYSPMTGNTGTKIRYAAAPTQIQSKYGSQVRDRLSDIGQGARRSAPLIKAIKVAVKKTDDPFTQIKEQKSYAPQEENAIGSQIEGIADAAQDAVSEGVAQAETAVEEFRKGSSQKAAERRAQRQQERQSDLKARKAAADERAALRGDMKKLFARDKRMYGNTVPKGSFGSGTNPGPAVDTRPRHSEGGPGDQPKVSKFEKPKPKPKPKRGIGQGSSTAVLGRTTRRQGEKPTGPAVKLTNYKDIRKKRLDAKKAASEARKEGTAVAVNASSFQQKNVRGSTSFKGTGKDESARRRTVPSGSIGISKEGRLQAAINRGIAAAKKTGIPSNTAVQGGAMSQAARDQAAINRGIKAAEATGIPTKPVAGSFNISKKGEAEAEANKAESRRKQAEAKAKAEKVKSYRPRKQAAEQSRASQAAAKAKAEGKTKAQQAAAARKAAGPNRTMGFGQQTRAQAGPSARTAAGNRARVKANARKRAQAAARKRKANKAKSSTRSRTRSRTRSSSRRRGRRRGRRRCDIRCKVNISLLMNMNLLRDDLADVAYFVRELREVEL
jgi:hypothetical protein